MKVLHTIPWVGQKVFGLGPVIWNLVKYQRTYGLDSNIWCADDRAEVEWALENAGLERGTIRNFTYLGPGRLCFSPAMQKAILTSEGARYDILHQHDIWTAISQVSNRWRAAYRRPTLITVHGAMDGWALKKSAWKKRMALMLYERSNFRDVSCFHALSESEAEAIRAFGLKNPIAVIPNGIAEEWVLDDCSGDRFIQKFRLPNDKRIMLFMGRITPKKGLPLLIEAMNSLKNEITDWLLIIAGSDEFDHKVEVEKSIRSAGLSSKVIFVGALYGEDKRAAFSAAELFVLPSHSEGAPIVILEALGGSVPVVTTKASPWEELVTSGCGWWTDISSHSVAAALYDATRKSTSDLKAMGQRGRNLVLDRYTWTRIASMSIQLYTWLLKSADKPDFVQIAG